VDADADLDAAVANSAITLGTPSVALLINNADATFEPPVYYDGGTTPFALTFGDFDLDGDADLAVANHNAILNQVSILVNDGQGTFGLPMPFPAGGYPYSVLAANLNDDLKPDFVCAVDTNLSVLINQTPVVVVGDLDGDGTVGVLDFLGLLAAWGPCPDPPAGCPGDLDGDGNVGVTDLLMLLANWG
jgi:hypothetical protein